ncbi:hypothetical protein [Nocardia cerradoensis]|uniref:hypothetical protein n=2 Tax=Nocardia cerradoensis TaxID=85688 RepID=UPI0014440987|nr:hypothetical protein [Nocardia cerradoensis]NKY48284.1 hypothetical protein [Nocardia cerradoensis]
MLDEQSTTTTAVPPADSAHPPTHDAARATQPVAAPPATPKAARRRGATEHSPQAELNALARRVATARGKLPLQADPALFAELSDREIAAERDLAEWIRTQRRRQRKRAVTAQLSAEKRDRRVALALRRADDADARWHRRARAARMRVSNPDARLAQLFRRAEWSSRALIGVVVLGMVWAGVNVQHNLVPSGDMSDPLYWLSYGFEAMISIPIITIMVVATTAARWGRDIDRGKVVFLETALLGVTIALNAGPHLVAGAPARAAEAAVAPVMVGVVIWLHAWVSARYAQLIDDIPMEDIDTDLPPTGYRPSYRPDDLPEWAEARPLPESTGTAEFPSYPQLPSTAVPQPVSVAGWDASLLLADAVESCRSTAATVAASGAAPEPVSAPPQSAARTAPAVSMAFRSPVPASGDEGVVAFADSPTVVSPAASPQDSAAPTPPAAGTTAANASSTTRGPASAEPAAAYEVVTDATAIDDPTGATATDGSADSAPGKADEPAVNASAPTEVTEAEAPPARTDERSGSHGAGLRIVSDEPRKTRTRRAVDDAVQLVLGEPVAEAPRPVAAAAELDRTTPADDPADLAHIEDTEVDEAEFADIESVAVDPMAGDSMAVDSMAVDSVAVDAAEDETGEVAIRSVAHEIRRRGLSKLSVDQLAEILTLTDESWTPAAIGAAIGLPGSRILGILEAARRISMPMAVGG